MTPEEARQQAEREVRQGQGWANLQNVHHETRNAYETERRIQEQRQQQQNNR